jgi:mRNA-degrading endonuclease RelE of RelBE toxin-antitoxin system
VYTIKLTENGLADVKALPRNVKNSLKAELLEKLATDPYNHSTELSSVLRGWRSFQWMDYRVVFKVYDDLKAIGIEAVGKHDHEAQKDIYKRLEVLVEKGKLANSVLSTFRGFTQQP